MGSIHPTAVVDSAAQLGENVTIGPYCVLGPQVCVGDGATLMNHVNLAGNLELGRGCVVYPFASLGTRTQDLKYKGGNPGVRIGARTTIREYVTINEATADGDYTVVGDDCLIMAYCHVAHDCIVGNEVIMANLASLSGHVVVEDQAIIGGMSGIHQFVRVGRMAIIGGMAKVIMDIPPYMMADGAPVAMRGLNRVALQRREVPRESQAELKKCYRLLYRDGLSTSQAVEKIHSDVQQTPEVAHLLAFIAASERGLTK